MNRLPFRFDPKRHRRLLRLSRIRRIALVIHVMFLSFFFTVAVFSFNSMTNWRWLAFGAIISLFSGMILRYVSVEIKKEHH